MMFFSIASDQDSKPGIAQGTAGNLDSIDTIFKRALSGSYEKLKDVKDKGLKSERTGHTVNATIETSRALVSFLKNWIETVGSGMEFDQDGIVSKNVSSITGMYLLMDQVGALNNINPLEKFYGLDDMRLPVPLSALAVIGEIYS